MDETLDAYQPLLGNLPPKKRRQPVEEATRTTLLPNHGQYDGGTSLLYSSVTRRDLAYQQDGMSLIQSKAGYSMLETCPLKSWIRNIPTAATDWECAWPMLRLADLCLEVAKLFIEVTLFRFSFGSVR